MESRIFNESLFKKLFSFIILASILASTFSVSAQTRRAVGKKTGSAAPSKPAGQKPDSKCNGGWSGTITYTQTLEDSGSSDEPGIRSEKDRIIQQWSHNVSYNGRMTVDGSHPFPAAFGNVEYGDARRQHGIEKVWDSCGAWKPAHWFIIDGQRDETETGSGSGQADDFNLNVNEFNGTYSFSFRFPDVKGKYNLEDHTKRTGHCQPQNNAPDDLSRTEETKINGESARVEDQKLDPKNPNVLSGSMTIDRNDYRDPKSVKTPVTVISWKFRRCSPPLVITDVKFYQPLYPSPNSWNEIKPNGRTIDGNQVKIVASIANLSGESKTTFVNFKELTENANLPEANIQVNLEPHQEREVEYVWDTSGYAWKEATWNQPEIHRQIEVKIPADSMTKDIEVDPKPVVVIPGLWSNPAAVGKFMGFFQSIPTTEWKAEAARIYVGKTAAENAPILEKTVQDLQKKENAWHVDLVAHSTGGLIGRYYVNSLMPVQFDGKPTVAHLVMIGTPNLGTPCAGGVDNIITKIFNRQADSLREVMVKNMRAFNQTVTNTNGTKFAALVGNGYAPICQLDAPGDSITPNLSAIWNIKKWKFSTVKTRHEDMPGEHANFMQIVNWLAVSPKGEKPDETTGSLENSRDDSDAALSEETFGTFRNYGAMFHPASESRDNIFENANPDDDPEPNFSTGIKLAPNQSTDVEIPVTNGSKLSLIFLAPPNVSATLIDDKGQIAGKNLAGTPEAAAAFRTISVKNPFQKGTWKLKLESREQTESEIAITMYIDFNSKIFAEKLAPEDITL